ncbi:MAG: Gfo/Idh/MocA family oxidoreductase [Spirochaetes bacterium]|nr:Gfo/Idh/MocA family oxidoreductase [Spirochaetota bacterium]
MKRIRWGILGTGKIAHKFATAMAQAKNVELIAVGSRQESTAKAFADEFKIPHRHASYEALVRDTDVDAIYVASLNTQHKDHTILCLNAGKAVLCEKPFALNTRETEAMIQTAREKKVFLMEAMWSRFIPAVVKAKELVLAGKIGEIRMLAADFGFRGSDDPKNRVNDPAVGGSSMLDVGIYPLSLAQFLLGDHALMTSTADIGPTGVDRANAVVLQYNSGALAVLSSAVNAVTIHEAFISGTKGEIRIHAPWWRSERVTVYDNGKEIETFSMPHNTYAHEADHVGDCLAAGLTESPVMPLDETRALMKTMDALRASWGIRYPGE